jgi:hypothetical protein
MGGESDTGEETEVDEGMEERRREGCFIPMKRNERKRKRMIIGQIRNGKEIP